MKLATALSERADLQKRIALQVACRGGNGDTVI